MNKIKKLSLFLEERGLLEEAHYVSILSKIAGDLTPAQLSKLRYFVSGTGEEPASSNKSSPSDIEVWKRVIQALDEKGIAFEQVDAVGTTLKGIGDGIAGAVGKIYNWATGSSTKQEVEQLNKKEAKKAVRELERIIKRAEKYGESELLKVANQKWWIQFANGNLQETSYSTLKKEAIGFSSVLKGLPIVGTFVSLYSLFKNLKEAFVNGKIILEKLPLNNYSITTRMIFTLDATGISEAFDNSIASLKDVPDAPNGQPSLRELAQIMNVISRFWMDCYKTVLNAIYSIIDVSELLVGLLDGPFPFADYIAQTFGGFLAMGIVVGAEMGGEYFSQNWWAGQKNKIRTIAEQHLSSPPTETNTEPVETEAVETKATPKEPTPEV